MRSQLELVSSNLQKCPKIRKASNSAEVCYIITVHWKDFFFWKDVDGKDF